MIGSHPGEDGCQTAPVAPPNIGVIVDRPKHHVRCLPARFCDYSIGTPLLRRTRIPGTNLLPRLPRSAPGRTAYGTPGCNRNDSNRIEAGHVRWLCASKPARSGGHESIHDSLCLVRGRGGRSLPTAARPSGVLPALFRRSQAELADDRRNRAREDSRALFTLSG